MFDDALLESGNTRRTRSKGLSLPLAIGLHAAVVGAFLGASLWHTDEPAEPVIPVTFFQMPAGPPPPIGTGGSERRRSSSPRSHATASFPTVMPATPEPRDDAPDSEALASESEQHGSPGDPNGVEAGMGTHPSVPGVDAGGAPLPVGGDVHAPELILKVEPAYSEAARRAHIEGMVILEAIITASGEVEDIRLLRSANPLLDEAVERAVRQWRYKPATLNGRAVRVFLTVTVRFGISS